ncbi:MAG TPA: universal stress protein [Polyangiaceae bacterium]|jgi:nucleotide-binding universal stress UspA family protein|nr:universal stress protein [Polyangiaceae bacterium]
MPKVSKILVPIDFSPHSEMALAYAVDLAKSLGSRVHLVHVYPVTAYAAPPLMPGPVVFAQFRDESQRVFGELMTRVKREYSADLEGTLKEGVPHVEILRCASDLGVDMIVMGTHGHTGIEHLLLGSVAERVVRGAKVPVLTVPLRG